jgi:ABC-2 type transport system permease protein
MSTDVERRHATTAHALPLRAEIGRQLRRRRTQVAFGLVLALPLLLVGAFALGSSSNGGSGGAPGFVDLAQTGGANLAVFALFASVGFLLVVLVALFTGDPVPSEASWSTLRYLLAAPVPRGRLLLSKLVVGLGTSLVALVLLPAWSVLVGGIAYGFGPFTGPSGDTLDGRTFALRMLVVVGAIAGNLLFVAALAFALGVFTDAPLAAVGGAVMVTIVSLILDSINALGSLREGLPTHYQFAWADALALTPQYGDVVRGTLWSVAYAVVLLSLAWWRFERKDVLS